jgi:hypothetical protein
MAEAILSAGIGAKSRFYSRERVDEIVLLLREAEKCVLASSAPAGQPDASLGAGWTVKHINSGMFMGRYGSYWTRTHDVTAAEKFCTSAEADSAMQALRQEAADRVKRSAEMWPEPMWWDIYGGLVMVVEVPLPAPPDVSVKEQVDTTTDE